MASKNRFALNVGMNWAAMVVGMVVPFFLTPIVIRSLGTVAYGVWILAVSTVAYLGLLDLGLRSAVIRYVSKADALGRTDEAQSAISAALWFRILLAVVAVVLSFALALVFPHLFKVPNGLERPAQITVLMCAFAIAITLVSGVFGAVLSAIHRFDILSGVMVMQTVAKAVGVILILRSGRGLIALAYWEFAVTLLAGLVTWGAAVKIFPACRVKLGRPDIKTIKMIWLYSLTTFIIVIAVQVVFNTDNIVVGALVSVGAVAFYSIGGSLVAYSRQVVSSVATTFIPMASNLEASGNSEELQQLLLKGTQATLALALPVSLVLLFRGKTFIGLWMGHQYSDVAGTVLQILMISQFFGVANTTAGQIAFGIEKHKSVANWAIVEAALNLSLSIVLAKTIGLYGVAWGTSIATTIIHLIFWPRFVQRELGVPVRTYLWEGWGKITLCSIPFGIVCVAADWYWHPTSMVVFFGQILVTLPVYAIFALWLFKDEVRKIWGMWRRSRQLPIQDVSLGEG
jgi:O-antigen/teichoic acid export membrane protein